VPGERVISLRAAVRGEVSTDPQTSGRVAQDASHLTGRPLAVVVPSDTDDVVKLVRWARRSHVPLVARGGGTSLDGESVPPDGAVVVDFAPWNQLLEVDPDQLWARVQPGIVNRELHRQLLPHGVFFPPNPGSWTTSTIGGNVATNASGMRSFRYGPTRAWVREVTAVLGTGEKAHFGTRVAKRSVGPDLLQLFLGSEGTLGLATEVTVRLAPLPPVRRGVVVPLPGSTTLGNVAARLAHLPSAGLSAVEYLDRGCAATIAERRPVTWPRGDAALLLLEVEADDAPEADRRLARLGTTLARAGARTDGFTVFEDADELWTIRGMSGDVLNERFGHHVREDVAVPLDRVDELVTALATIARKEAVPYFLFGHLGEGSLHPNYAVDPATAKAERIRGSVLRAARTLGGTISAEHGVGRVKRPYLEEELGSEAVRVLAALKRACDPDGILNPGDLYPPSPTAAAPSRSPSGRGAERAAAGSPTVSPVRPSGRPSRSRPRRRRAVRP